MKPLMLAGILLSAFGVICLLFPSVYCTGRRTVANSGSTEVSVKTERFVPLSPLLGVASLAAGLTSMVLAARK